jgi:hypothetical protein
MTPGEVARLLAAAAMFDYRKVEKADAQAWHFVLGDLEFDDAMQALRCHYAESTERLMPAHVRQGVRAIRNERANKAHSEALALPSRFEDDEDRTERARRGSVQVHEVIAELAQRMQDRADSVPDDAMERLRELTDGPAMQEGPR